MNYCIEKGVKYLEVSAKTDYNIYMIFEKASANMQKQYMEELNDSFFELKPIENHKSSLDKGSKCGNC
jgi:hypothetical protein